VTEHVQPIVLLVDRENPAPAVDGISAVAGASAISFRARDVNDPAWVEWLSGPFAKSVRRADAKTFRKVITELGDLSPVIYEVGDARAAAFPPMPTDQLPKLLSKLQVSNTHLPDKDSAAPAFGARTPTIWLNADLDMSTGKAAAQAAHAAMLWLIQMPDAPVNAPLVVFRPQTILEGVAEDFPAAVIRDAGRTEIAPNSLTAVATA
jgi:hypothetical protein